MPLKGISKPSMNSVVKTGFKLMSQKVTRATRPEKPFVRSDIGTNHPMTSMYAGKKRPKSKMF